MRKTVTHLIYSVLFVLSTLSSLAQCDNANYADLGGPCAASVCSYDSWCCNNEWDNICAGEAASDPSCQYCWADCHDNDLDGYTNCDGDCDDFDAGVNPGAFDVCGNGIDENCNGIVDDASCDEVGYSDFGSQCAFSVCSYDSYCCNVSWDLTCASEATVDAACEFCWCGCYDNDLDGYTNCDGDCEDFNPDVNPGVIEVCNGLDDDCNGLIDDNTSYGIYYADNDGDGYGDAFLGGFCDAPVGATLLNGDCDDFNDLIYPGAPENCSDGYDNDCDGGIDNASNTCDNAGYNDFASPCGVSVCSYDSYCCNVSWDFTCAGEAASDPNCVDCWCGCYDNDLDGYTNCDGDCNDFDDTINPGATEDCADGIDNDCDGLIDNATGSCDAAGYDISGSACAAAVCSYDGFCCSIEWDNICAGEATADENCQYCWCGCYDNDLDGYTNCDGDCDDFNPDINPGGIEICNGADDDCNGIIDDGAGLIAYYADNDFDGFGDLYLGSFCDAPFGSSDVNGDCDDFNPDVNPGALEICSDGYDNDCDGGIDNVANTCDNPGYSDFAGDCATSVCSYDAFCCNTAWDFTCAGEAASDPTCLYCLCGCYDNDLDGYTNCDGDCDDFNDAVNPGITELCGNGIDDDCDGSIDLVAGACDQSGYSDLGSACAASVCSYDAFCCSLSWDAICAGEATADASCQFCWCGCYDNDLDGYTNCDGDCDDFNPEINPGAVEICNGTDDDCNGIIDNGAESLPYYADFDSDGFGEFYLGNFCDAPFGSSLLNGDCNDSDPTIFPGAIEDCQNGIDNDCDGFIDNVPGTCDNIDYSDLGGDCATSVCSYDSYCCNVSWDFSCASEAASDPACTYCLCGCYDNDLDSYTNCDGDCDDFNDAVNPGMAEDCNGIDDNCDGNIDEGMVAMAYYEDLDGDGYGAAYIGDYCIAPANSVDNNQDCDDNNSAANPGATEICDNLIDDDCDGSVDVVAGACDQAGYSDLGSACAVSVCSYDSWCCNNEWDNICAGEAASDENCQFCWCGCYDNDLDGYSNCDGDCDDFNQYVYPNAPELCNGADDNCDGIVDEDIVYQDYYTDADGDGYGDAFLGNFCDVPVGGVLLFGDCDDTNAALNPGAEDICFNGIDEDCSGIADDGAGTCDNAGYTDLSGSCATSVCSYDAYCCEFAWDLTCASEAASDENCQYCWCGCYDNDLDGFTNCDGDCDDFNAAINPDAVEICGNNIDEDCDGTADNAAGSCDVAGYSDLASPCATSVCSYDSWCCNNSWDNICAGEAASDANCVACWCGCYDNDLDGYTNCDGDCDDFNDAVNPGMVELCNGIDEDCNGLIDDNAPYLDYYADLDGDGYGGDLLGQFCSVPANSSTNNLDCDDTDSAVNPDGIETCNDIDDDCDGLVDDNIGNTYYADADGDGYGDASSSTMSCTLPVGYVTSSTDCDDTDSAVNPGASESCNQMDDNCNGQTDEGLATTVYYADADGDGFGGASLGAFCSQPAGSVINSTDCDDNNNAVHPGATETCNGQDDNCNGQVDEGLATQVYYADADGDGFGGASLGASCSQPANSTLVDGDCDDADASVHPGAIEQCNNNDDDCDGLVDNNVVYADYYLDIDGDGFGNSYIGNLCVAPANSSTTDGDCDDGDATVNPDAVEVCNNADDNCNGSIDEGLALTAYYSDLDGDGYGSASLGEFCSAPAGATTDNSDCDDTDSGVHPNAPEFCNNTDDDCDGQVDDGLNSATYYSDADGDGFGGALLGTFCFPPANSSVATGDCDDTDSQVNPNGSESCNSADDNCDGVVDEFLLTNYYMDADGDGYGDPGAATSACSEPVGYVANAEDCDDTNSSVNPDATEFCNNIDDDCNEAIDDNCIDSVDEIGGTWNVQLYPNPVIDQLSITVEGTVGQVNYIIYDAIGKVVISSKLNSGSANLVDCSALSQGSYTLTISNNGSMVHRKFVKL